MNIGEAVKERIIELCRERDISINKLCNMSVSRNRLSIILSADATTVPRFQPSKSYAMAWVSRFRSSLLQIFFLIWSRRLNKTGGGTVGGAA